MPIATPPAAPDDLLTAPRICGDTRHHLFFAKAIA
jgi:hypothetical protein